MLFPLHHHPATSSLAACIEVEIPVHGEDNRDAHLWNDLIHLGFGRW